MGQPTIYHNPRCSKSRATLALLQSRGWEPEVIEYLKAPPDAATLRQILDALGIAAVDLIREREHTALGLDATADETELLRRMVAHPQILQRPIVVHGGQARIGRPPEQVLEIL